LEALSIKFGESFAVKAVPAPVHTEKKRDNQGRKISPTPKRISTSSKMSTTAAIKRSHVKK